MDVGKFLSTSQFASEKHICTTAIDWDDSNVQYLVLSSGDQTLTFSNPLDGGQYAIIIKQPAAGAAGTITWPAGVTWVGGTSPTLKTDNDAVDVVTLVYDGTNTEYYGGVGGAGSGGTPTDVTVFSGEFVGESLRLTWTPIDITPQGYEVRTEDANWGVESAALVYRGQSSEVTFNVASRTPGTYYIRAFNGVDYSTSSGSTTPTKAVPAAIVGFGAEVVFSSARLYWTNSVEDDIQKYQVYRSETNVWGGEEELLAEVDGAQITTIGKSPRSTTVTAENSDTIFVCDGLIGFDNDYFLGHFVRFTVGDLKNETGIIASFDGTTGTVTMSSAFTSSPKVGDFLDIHDIIYVKVCAVDSFGPGTLSIPLEVVFESVNADMIEDKSITPRKLDVTYLSDVSEDMGYITDGTISGATVLTGSGSQHLSFNSSGIYGYNSSCVQTLHVDTDGSILAQSAKFVDPACGSFYSYFNAGGLVYHDNYGDIPYVRRVANGTATNGSTVTLDGWTSEPKITVGINSLTSYSSAYSSQSQQWSVHYDNVAPFCNSSIDYGYKFNVHAELRLSTGQSGLIVCQCLFGVPVYTSACTCSASLRYRFLSWCNNDAPSNYWSGNTCYRIWYRVSGAGSYCCYGDCSHLHPYSSLPELQSYSEQNVTLTFPCMATWDILTCCLSTSWVNTGICATGTCICCSSTSVSGINCCFNSGWHCCTTAVYSGCCVNISCYYCPSWNGASCTWTLYRTDSYGAYCGCATICATRGYFGTTWAESCLGFQSFSCRCCVCGPACISHGCNTGACTRFYIRLWGDYSKGGFYGSALVCYCYSFCLYDLTRCLYYCCTHLFGGAQLCTSLCTYGLCNTYGCYCILDAAGTLNWSAVGYT